MAWQISDMVSRKRKLSVKSGAVSPSEDERNAAHIDLPIPQDLWDELKAEKLLPPMPSSRSLARRDY
jgi:hypothetical protein